MSAELPFSLFCLLPHFFLPFKASLLLKYEMENQMEKVNWFRKNVNKKRNLVVRQFIIYHCSSSSAPGFQYSLGALKQITDSITCPFGSIALSLKENFTVPTFLFRTEEIRVSGVVGVVSGMGLLHLLLLILQALGCVGDVWLVVELAKWTFFCVMVHNLRAVHLLDEYTTWLALLWDWTW